MSSIKYVCDPTTYFDFKKLYDLEYCNKKNLSKYIKHDYTLLKYKMDAITNKNIMTLGLFKSVILVKNQIKCISPFKSVEFDLLYNYFGDKGDFNYTFHEFVEGPMINVFHNGEEWELSTRSLIGGRGCFYKDCKMTFREMFIECMNESRLEFSHLDKDMCYSFVIQHPENRIVKKVFEPKLYLCNVFKFEGYKVYSIDYQKDELLKDLVLYPKSYCFDSIDDVLKYNKERYPTDYETRGIIIEYGPYRSKIENPKYNHVLELRGNHSKPKFNFLRLWKENKLDEFLLYFPEYIKKFNKFQLELDEFIVLLYNSYIKYMNSKSYDECIDYEFIPHVIAMANSRIKSDLYTTECVMNYVKGLPTARLMFAINFKNK